MSKLFFTTALFLALSANSFSAPTPDDPPAFEVVMGPCGNKAIIHGNADIEEVYKMLEKECEEMEQKEQTPTGPTEVETTPVKSKK